MPIRFTDEQAPVKGKIRFLEDAPQAPQDKSSLGESLVMGALDPVYGTGQLIGRGLEAVTSLGGYAPNPVSEAYKRSYQGIDKETVQREKDYNKPQGVDTGRIIGNIASPMNYVGAGAIGRVAQAPALASRVAGGALIGGAGSAMQPVTNIDNYGMEKLGQFGTGAAFGAALPVAGQAVKSTAGGVGNIYKGATARNTEQLGGVLDEIKDLSRGLYKQSEQAGAVLTPNAAGDLSLAVSNIVKNADTKASQTLYSDTLNALRGLNDDLAKGNAGLETIDAHRQILGNIAKNITNPNRAQEAEAARRAIDAIDGVVEKLTPAQIQNSSKDAVDSLVQARKAWSQARKFEKISDIVNNAKGDANKLKRDLDKLVNSGAGKIGWTPAEKEALKAAAQQTTGEGFLKMIGKFGFDLGAARPMGNTALPVLATLGTGLSSGGMAAAAVPVIGTASRMGQKAIARGKTERLLNEIAQGSTKDPKALAKILRGGK